MSTNERMIAWVVERLELFGTKPWGPISAGWINAEKRDGNDNPPDITAAEVGLRLSQYVFVVSSDEDSDTEKKTENNTEHK